jgi:hypothetical protein
VLDSNHYDSILDDQETRPVPCPVCTGDQTAEPCGEECDAIVKRVARRVRIKGYYMAARSAMRWAKGYARRSRDNFDDAQVLAILDQIRSYRRAIATLRAEEAA